METLSGASGRIYTPLPIDSSRGFPQAFPFLFSRRNFRFRLYVNVPPSLVEDKSQILNLPFVGNNSADLDRPPREAFLVVQVELDLTGGERRTAFLRKVVPELEYEAEDIALIFPLQRLAVRNLNGQGDFGSQVTGGIALR